MRAREVAAGVLSEAMQRLASGAQGKWRHDGGDGVSLALCIGIGMVRQGPIHTRAWAGWGRIGG